MAKRMLITGITGFIGRTLANKYLEKDYEVYGNTFDKDESPLENKEIKIKYCDIRNESQVDELVEFSKPDLVFHLSAQPYPLLSWSDPKNTFETNVNGTINLLSTIRDQNIDPKIVVACSSAEYGMTAFNSSTPLIENDKLLPIHPYGLSKVCQDILSYQYFKKYNMRILRARIFNTIGPGKKGDFVGDVSQQIDCIKKGFQEPIIKIGNLDTKRDFTDVRDQSSALIALAESGKVGDVYNVCSGKAVSMQEVLDKMIKISGIEIKIETEPKRVRSIDEPIIIGDPSKIQQDCSWTQKYDLETTLRESIDFWN